MIRAIGIVLAAMLNVGAVAPPVVNDALILSDELPSKLSAFRLLLGSARVPNAHVLPYALRTPLFSDYAEKTRYAYVPVGKRVDIGSGGVLAFPVGSVLIKSFGYPADFRQPNDNVRIIETRLMVHRASGWVALPYVWDADGQDATLKRAGTRTPVSWTHGDGSQRSLSYSVPNVNQCKDCHMRGAAMTPIGPKPQNLHPEFLRAIGFAKGVAPMPVWNDPKTGTVAQRARAYLDVNCAHCHSRDGAASNSGLYLGYDEPSGPSLGVLKGPVAAGRGSGDLAHDIEPGHPEQSIMIYRLKSLDPGIAMPELGRASVHDEGVALLSDWITAMPAQP